MQSPNFPDSLQIRELRLHAEDQLLVFDDSKLHAAFNAAPSGQRVVLILDFLRPPGVPPGRAVGGHTLELDKFINIFN